MNDGSHGIFNPEIATDVTGALGDAHTTGSGRLNGSSVNNHHFPSRCKAVGGSLGDVRNETVSVLIEIGTACGVLEQQGNGGITAGRDRARVGDIDVTGAAGIASQLKCGVLLSCTPKDKASSSSNRLGHHRMRSGSRSADDARVGEVDIAGAGVGVAVIQRDNT